MPRQPEPSSPLAGGLPCGYLAVRTSSAPSEWQTGHNPLTNSHAPRPRRDWPTTPSSAKTNHSKRVANACGRAGGAEPAARSPRGGLLPRGCPRAGRAARSFRAPSALTARLPHTKLRRSCATWCATAAARMPPCAIECPPTSHYRVEHPRLYYMDFMADVTFPRAHLSLHDLRASRSKLPKQSLIPVGFDDFPPTYKTSGGTATAAG